MKFKIWKPPSVPVVEFRVWDDGGNLAPFTLSIYGVPIREFLVTPGGGGKAHEALERRGFIGYQCSPFAMREAPAIQRSYRRVEPATGVVQGQEPYLALRPKAE